MSVDRFPRPRLRPPSIKRARTIDAQVGSRVRSARELSGMSQTRLGKLLGLTFQRVQKYENDTNRISAGRLFQIAQIFAVPIDYFYEEVVDRHASSRSKDAAFSAELTSLTSNENIQLAIAFMSIADVKIRRRVVAFVKSLGADGDG